MRRPHIRSRRLAIALAVSTAATLTAGAAVAAPASPAAPSATGTP